MRNEIKKEVEFLETWSIAFAHIKKQQIFNFKVENLEIMHQTAVDATSALKGGEMAWHDDKSIIVNLKYMKEYLKTLNKKGYFSNMQSFKQAESLCQSVIDMLSATVVAEQGNLF